MVPRHELEQASQLKHILSIYVLGKTVMKWGYNGLEGVLLNRHLPKAGLIRSAS
jgi:hypothetical protein